MDFPRSISTLASRWTSTGWLLRSAWSKGIPLRLYNRLSYQNKLLIFMMAMVVFVGGTMGLLIRFIILPHLTLEMENRGEAVVRRLVESTRTFILSRDITGLTASLFDEKQLEKSIAYIVVGDDEDRLLAHTFVGQVPDIDARVFQVANGQMRHGLAAVAHASAGEISDMVAPVYEGLYQIGTIRVGIDKRHVHAVIRQLNLYHLGFMAFITVVSLVFAMVPVPGGYQADHVAHQGCGGNQLG